MRVARLDALVVHAHGQQRVAVAPHANALAVHWCGQISPAAQITMKCTN